MNLSFYKKLLKQGRQEQPDTAWLGSARVNLQQRMAEYPVINVTRPTSRWWIGLTAVSAPIALVVLLFVLANKPSPANQIDQRLAKVESGIVSTRDSEQVLPDSTRVFSPPDELTTGGALNKSAPSSPVTTENALYELAPEKAAQVQTISGVMRYQNIEGGCWYLEVNGSVRYELVGNVPEEFKKEGWMVEVKGRPSPNVMTICQIGTSFEVSSISNK